MKFDITQFKPCDKGLEYYEGKSSFEKAWNDCPRGDWMLWIAAMLRIDERTLTRAKALCANTVRHLMKDERSTDAIDAALRYSNYEIDREELNKYADAADDAIADAANDAATAAAAAANTTYAAYVAARAAAYAADAAAYVAARASAYVAARAAADAIQENRQQTADICRDILTDAVFEKIKQL